VWVQQQKVTAANGAVGDFFGNSVALSDNGTTALVGADNKMIGGNTNQGAAYVYTLAGGTWSQAAELTAADGAVSDNFGRSVALSSTGATALVGAYGKAVGQGAAYVYTLAGGTWSQAAELTASNGAVDDYFGISVALSSTGATALVGAFYKTVGGNGQQGAAYVYTFTGGTWSQAAELTASNGAIYDYFGISVALSSTGATALVGAYGKTVGSNTNQGAAYVYTLSGGIWGQVGELTASNGAAHDSFGSSVALSSNGATALVGADGKTVGGNTYQGAAYVFTTTSVWSTSTQTELTASNGATFDGFGSSVALSANGSTALVGAGSRGAAYVFTTTNVWPTNTQAELTASGSAVGDYFGSSVALSADGITALVGAPSTVIPAGNNIHGAAYFFGNSDLSVVLSAPAMVQTGAQFSSQYILTNASATASAALVVSLPVPATNAGYVSASASQGACSYDSTTKVVTCAVGSIPGNGGTASATLNLKATGAANSTIAQSGQLVNGSPDLAQTTSTTIVPPPPSGGGTFGPWVLLGLALLIGLARRRARD